MTGRAHLRPVSTTAHCGHQTRHGDQVLTCCYTAGHDGAHEHDPAPQPEPIARVEIQWGHRLAASYPDREKYADRDDISWCRDPQTLAHRTTPCDRTTVMGLPIDHIWRRVIVTTWQDGQP